MKIGYRSIPDYALPRQSLRSPSKRLRGALLLCAAMTSLASSYAVRAQEPYPNRPVTLIVPFSAGGGTDVTARLIASKLGQKWNTPVVVENRAGAGGLIGADWAAKAQPTGYTLLIGNVGTQSINPSLYAKLPYDPKTAFTPISLIAQLPIVMLASPKLPVKTVQDFVSLARQNPEKYSFASSGAGNSTHLAGEIFQAATGVKLLHVPYKGGGPATADLIAGHVDIQFTSVLESTGHIKGGLVRALAVTDAQRTQALPDVPTLAEAGVPNADAGSWIALLGPAGLPSAIAQQISRDVHEVIATPEMQKSLLEQGATAVGSTPQQLAQVIDADTARYAEVISKLGLKANP